MHYVAKPETLEAPLHLGKAGGPPAWNLERCMPRVHVDISLKGNANDKGGFREIRLAERQEVLCDNVAR